MVRSISNEAIIQTYHDGFMQREIAQFLEENYLIKRPVIEFDEERYKELFL